MKKEKAAVEKEVGLEEAWANYMNRLRSPSFFVRLKDLFK